MIMNLILEFNNKFVAKNGNIFLSVASPYVTLALSRFL